MIANSEGKNSERLTFASDHAARPAPVHAASAISPAATIQSVSRNVPST